MSSSEAEVVVVGAGLAGLSCAFRLAEAGRRVLVLEAGSVLGGRTSSWSEEGMPVESGLHKFLGFYRELRRLLRDVGAPAEEILDWVDEVAIRVPDGGPEAVFSGAPYQRPLQTLLGIAGNNGLIPPAEKAKLTAMAGSALRDVARRPLELDRTSVADYARRFRVSERTIATLQQALTAGVLFMPAEDFSAYATFAPIWEALKSGMSFRLGAFKGGMTEVMVAPIGAAIVRHGGEIRSQSPVRRILVEEGRVRGVEVDGQELRAEQVVLATSLAPAQRLIGTAFPQHPWFQGMLRLKTLSAVTIQFELERPSFSSDRTHFSPHVALCCYAEQSRTTFRHAPGRLSVILYPPEEFLTMAPEAIFERTLDDADRLGIPLRGHVQRYRIVRHPHDFYALRPGAEALRPSQATPVPGLTLAGDYTRQPLVASMEGATLSGRLAADYVLGKKRRLWITVRESASSPDEQSLI